MGDSKVNINKDQIKISENWIFQGPWVTKIEYYHLISIPREQRQQ